MKILLTFATLLFAATVQATPAVGDYSNFALTLTQGTASAKGTYEISINSLRSDGYVMATVVTISGQPAQRSESVVPTTDLMTDATIASVLSDCASYGGQSQQITVPAGTFATCALAIDGGTAWLGQAPFGVIKQVQKQSDGSDLVLELNNFVNGK